jgi:hypothetical protein
VLTAARIVAMDPSSSFPLGLSGLDRSVSLRATSPSSAIHQCRRGCSTTSDRRGIRRSTSSLMRRSLAGCRQVSGRVRCSSVEVQARRAAHLLKRPALMSSSGRFTGSNSVGAMTRSVPISEHMPDMLFGGIGEVGTLRDFIEMEGEGF